MRVALCLSGQARSVKENFENIKENLIDPNNADVFVHTWFDEKNVGKRFSGKTANERDFVNNATLQGNTAELINALYLPKMMKIENQIQFVHDDVLNLSPNDPKNPFQNRWHIRPQFCLSMFYSIMTCNNLKVYHENDEGFRYDAVIRARFDLSLDRKYNMEDYDLDIIYANRHSHNQYSRQDVFAFSNSENMNMYSSIFNEIGVLMSSHKVEFCPEILLGYHLNQLGKEIRNVGGGYEIIR